MLTVLKACEEVEDPAWRLYDKMYGEKMVSTGVKQWPGTYGCASVPEDLCGAPLESKDGIVTGANELVGGIK